MSYTIPFNDETSPYRTVYNNALTHRRGTARRVILVENLSTAAYANIAFEMELRKTDDVKGTQNKRNYRYYTSHTSFRIVAL